MLKMVLVANMLGAIGKSQVRFFSAGRVLRAVQSMGGQGQKEESERLKQFREKMRSTSGLGEHRTLDDLVLVEIDQNTGEAVPDAEKDATKWGDWQHGGRVSDF